MIVEEVRHAGGDGVSRRLWGPLAIIRRRRRTLALGLALGLCLAGLGYLNAPRSYMSEAVMVLDLRRIEPIPNESVIAPMAQDSPVLRTQLDIIASRMMAADVVRRLEGEGFDISTHEVPGWTLPAPVAGVLDFVGLGTQGDENANLADEERELDEADKIDILLSNLSVRNDGRSYTIFIAYTSPSPELSAHVANAFAQAYLDHQINVQRNASRTVSDWLGQTLIRLRAQLEQSEVALQRYRQEKGLVETNGATLQSQALTKANAELADARAALISSQARLDAVRDLVKSGDIPAMAEFLGSTSIQSLRTLEAGVERELDSLRRSGATRSAQIERLTAEREALREQIGAEVNRLVESLGNEVAIAVQSLAAREDALKSAHADFAAADSAELTAAQLQREATANRMVYESYLVRYKQTIEQDNFKMPEAHLVSPAEPPAARANPRRSNWLLLGLGLGGCLAALGIAARELTDRRLRMLRRLESADIPVMGVVPAINRRKIADIRFFGDPSSRLGLALSGIRLSLQARGKSVVAVSSSASGRGRTSLALALTRSAAAAGIDAVLVEADLRNPKLCELVNLWPATGLDGLLGPNVDDRSLVTKDPASEAGLVFGRAGKVAPERLFLSPEFQNFIARLRENYDLVVLDTPALDTSNDAMVLSRLADTTLYLVDYRKDRPEQVTEGFRRMTAMGSAPEAVMVHYDAPASELELEPMTHPGTAFAPAAVRTSDTPFPARGVVRLAR